MFKFKIERCLNGRTHIWFLGIKILSWGPKRQKKFKNPKLGVSYSVWDGEELLEQSIKQIRSVADYVNVVWQKISWYGKPCNPDLEKLLLKLKAKGLIDEIILFEPDLRLNPSYNEINKRNVGLRAARRAKCTHFITMDTDEFYDTDEFRNAYNEIIEKNLSHTICNIVSYFKPTIRYRDYENFFVLFICRIDHGECFSFNGFLNGLPCVLDPTRRIKLSPRSRICFLGEIVMHHMKHVRRDIAKKINNSSFGQISQKQQVLQKMYLLTDDDVDKKLKNSEFIKVPNKFEIKL